MPVGVRPTVVWMPNIEIVLALVNLTEEGTRYQSRAVHPLRRAVWLRYDNKRRSPAVVETAALIKEGFWLDSLLEVALAADSLPKVGFSYALPRETAARAGLGLAEEGLTRLTRYLDAAAAFTLDGDTLDFLRTHGDSYRTAVDEYETALGDLSWTDALEGYFGAAHRSILCAASLLMPAGFSFGLSLETPEGPLACHVTGPFIEPDGRLTFAAPGQAAVCAERELVRAYIRPALRRAALAARSFVRVFEQGRDGFARLGYREPLDCLEDHLVQAVQCRLLARRGEKPAADALLRFDEDGGFVYERPLALGLEDYELHRADFPTLDDFLPRLLDSFARN
ncbi:MAG: DUF4932 domain-containing protein [bacterium]